MMFHGSTKSHSILPHRKMVPSMRRVKPDGESKYACETAGGAAKHEVGFPEAVLLPRLGDDLGECGVQEKA
jgi:hypothetical protein